MKVKGFNKLYYVDIKRMKSQGKDGVAVTCGSFVSGLTSVIISKKDWEKIKKEV
jgi:hypothetical protein